jgi:hypothetical protein
MDIIYNIKKITSTQAKTDQATRLSLNKLKFDIRRNKKCTQSLNKSLLNKV